MVYDLQSILDKFYKKEAFTTQPYVVNRALVDVGGNFHSGNLFFGLSSIFATEVYALEHCVSGSFRGTRFATEVFKT